MKTFLITAFVFLFGISTLQAASWAIDGAHSNINFKIRHLSLSTVTGSFGSFNGTIQYDPEKPNEGSASITIQIASINTGNAKRDSHLNNEDFFDSPMWPTATFESTSWTQTGENTFEITGDLTMHGQTHPVTLQAELLGTVDTQRGVKSGWEATTTLDRYEWKIGGEGGAQIGREVELDINVQAIQQS